MPYIAPEVLKGKPYTHAADIYSFGMIMYFVATGKQPFADRPHDRELAFNISTKKARPEIHEYEAPKFYIDLMKKCWSFNPDDRPSANEIYDLIFLFEDSYTDIDKTKQFYIIENQLKEAEKFRSLILKPIIHPKAIYTSRLLNHVTKDLPKNDNNFIEFSDNIGMEEFLLQHIEQLDL